LRLRTHTQTPSPARQNIFVSNPTDSSRLCAFALKFILMHAAVFLDRDGTIIADKDYLSRPEEVVMLPGAAAALKRLQDAGFKFFVVSNQSGVGRGYFTMEDVDKVNERICQELRQDGVTCEEIYIAPEAPEQPSRGRKPSPQFLFDARD